MALWTPSALAAPCDFWIDVQTGHLTKDGSDNVAQVDDESVNARHFSQATGANKPLWVASGVNGQASIRSSDGLRGLTHSGAITSYNMEAGLQGSTADLYFGSGDTADLNYIYNVIAADTATPHFWVYVWDPTGYWLYRDGNLQETAGHQNLGGTWPLDSGVIFLGIDLTGGGPNTFGRIVSWEAGADETVLFNRRQLDRGVTGDVSIVGVRIGSITTGDRQLIEGWGTWRLGLQANLPSGHPHENAAPTLAAVSPAGIASSAAVGSPHVKLAVAAAGVSSAAAAGSPAVGLRVSPAGVAGMATAGSPSVALRVAVSGIVGAAGIGQPHVKLRIAPTGIPAAGGFGSPSVGLRLAPSGIATAVGLGQPRVGLRIFPAGVTPSTAIGAPTVGSGVSPAGVASSAAVGQPRIALLVAVQGVVNANAFGVLAVGGIAPDPAPPERTLAVPFEDRTLRVPAENRTLRVPAENRTLTVRAA